MKNKKTKMIASLTDLYRVYLPKRYEKRKEAFRKNEDHSAIYSILESIRKEIVKEAKRL